MAYHINHTRVSGTVTAVRSVDTRSGKPMASLVIQCFRERFNLVIFGTLAKQALMVINTGDHVEAAGRLQSNDWTGQDGTRHRDLQIICEKIVTEDGVEIVQEKIHRRRGRGQQEPSTASPTGCKTGIRQQDLSEFDVHPNTPF